MVDTESICLTLYQYIEMNPVRAGIAVMPHEYPWSSYSANAMGIIIKLLTPHASYMSLGETTTLRLLRYRSLFSQALPQSNIDEIRSCTNKGWLLGSERFKVEVATQANRRVESCGWGGDRRSNLKGDISDDQVV